MPMEKKRALGEGRFFIFLIVLSISFGADAFGDTEQEVNMKNKVKLSAGEREIIFALSDNEAARDFLALLPLTLDFTDYNRTEKVSPLPVKLSTAGAPAGYDPAVGDLCLYAPWGNLCIFYRDFGYAGGLIKLGRVISGGHFLAALEGRVKIEVTE